MTIRIKGWKWTKILNNVRNRERKRGGGEKDIDRQGSRNMSRL